ncbi:MAG: nucleoside kinase, partial [Spirochaetaceae bacterium]|nr:nucleoside kinase [Spirochaetaceae bacterium]
MGNQLKIRILPGNNIISVPRGTRVTELIKEVPPDRGLPIVAVKICNSYASLMDSVTVDCNLEPVSLGSTAGVRIYRNSLVYLFQLASRTIFPDRRVVIGHSLGHGFFHRFRDGGPQANENDADSFEETMRTLVTRDLEIIPDEISWDVAVDCFRSRLFPSTSQLIEELNEPRVGIWRCDHFITLRHSPLVPRTGILKTFSVESYREGFLLRYPPSQTPDELGEKDDEPKLFSVYEEHKKWGENLGVSNVAQLNDLSRNRAQARDFIQTAEALHDRKIAEYAGLIISKRDRVKAVMIAGPSSSGKTTFTKKLA